MPNPTILVTGATGQLGSLIIDALLKTLDPTQVAALVRPSTSSEPDPRVSRLRDLGVETREGDYDDPKSLRGAMSGIQRLLFVSSNSFEPRGIQHGNVIDAAKTADVQFIAYTSILDAQNTPLHLAIDHRETEDMLAKSGLDYVALRNGWYMENHFLALPHALDSGTIIGAARQGKFSSATRADYAAAAAAVIHPDATIETTTLELAGDQAYTLDQLAAEVSLQTGQSVRYQDLKPSDFKFALADSGMAEGLASLLANTDVGASDGALFNGSGLISTLIGRPSTTLAEALAESLPLMKSD